VISTNHPVDRNGIPREGTRIADHGVAVYFMLKGKHLAMACDRFTNAAANMRSLALGIEHLRGLERHGGGVMMERAFSGFAALPPPKSQHWEVLDIPPGSQAHDIERAFRRKAMTTHPDQGGSDDAMAELNSAREAALREIGMA
jgi:hypothetical protein